MKRYIEYFDFLGYKQFIENNDSDHIKRRVGHILRDIELSLGQGKLKQGPNFAYGDTSKTRINSLTFSDTVLFWTQDDSIESLQELLKVTREFYWRKVMYDFPLRGALCYDDVELIHAHQSNDQGAQYIVNMIYGKGLVRTHLKAEDQDWAGFVIDDSVIQEIEKQTDVATFLDSFAVKYKVPYKTPKENQEEEFVYRIVKDTLNERAFENVSQGITETFYHDNKTVNDRVQVIIDNTINYLSIFKE